MNAQFRIRNARWLCIATLFASLAGLGDWVSVTRADPPPAKPTSSLDDELLKGLGGDPFDDRKKPPTKPAVPAGQEAQPAAKKTEPKKPAANGLDDELLKGLGDDTPGAKAADGHDENPLARLNRQMREVEDLIRRAKADTPTQEKQAEIVQELERLIKQLEQQAQQSGSSKSPKPQSKQQQSERSQAKQSQSKKGDGNGRPSDQAARDSSDQLQKREDRKPDAAQIQQLLKDVWGELPPRLRQQMMQSSVEKFLPKYELLIEDYFKALSEKQRSGD